MRRTVVFLGIAWLLAAGCGSRTGFLDSSAGGGGTGSSSGSVVAEDSGGSGGSSSGSDASVIPEATPLEEIPCSSSCDGTCIDGRCLVKLAPGPGYGIALYGGDVYWTAFSSDPPPPGPSSVMKVAIGGGAAVTLASNLIEPTYLAVEPQGAYWTSPYMPGEVMTVPLAGGTATTFAVNDNPSGIAADATNVYWYAGDSLLMAPLAGGPTVTLAASSRFFGAGSGIAVDSRNVYVGVNGEGTGNDTVSVPLGGGSITTLASGQVPAWLAVDATTVYWTNWRNGGGSVASAPIGGGATTTLAVGGDPWGIAVDDTTVYWTNMNGGSVVSVPIVGGDTTTLVTSQRAPQGIAVDATSLYWVSNDGVMKLTPK